MLGGFCLFVCFVFSPSSRLGCIRKYPKFPCTYSAINPVLQSGSCCMKNLAIEEYFRCEHGLLSFSDMDPLNFTWFCCFLLNGCS